MKKWIAAVGVILAVTAAIPIILNNDGLPPSDRETTQGQATSTDNRSEPSYSTELNRVAHIWKMEMSRLKGSRSGSPLSVMDLDDSHADATFERLQSVYEILAAKRDECEKFKVQKAAREGKEPDRTALGERRERLVITIEEAVDAVEKALHGVEAMAIPRADRTETARLWDQILTTERAGAGAAESISQWTVDRLLAEHATPPVRQKPSMAALETVLEERVFSKKLSRALFGKKTEILDELALDLDGICLALEESSEAIYVAAGESGAQRLDALTLLLGWVQRLESDGEMLCHALGDYRRTETDNLTDVGVALAGFLSTKASVAQHFDLFESAADRGDRPSSMADVKNAFRELDDLRADLDRLAGLRRRLEPIGTRLRCRFTKSQPLPPPRLAIDVQLDRAIQTAGWLKRVATAYSIYDASPADKE